MDQLALIGSKTNRLEILRLINNTINCKEIKVEVLPSSEMNLSLTDNKITIRIAHNSNTEDFDITFKNVKSYSEQEIDNLLNEGFKRINSNFVSLKDQCIMELKTKIIKIINDERVVVNRFFLTAKEKNICKVFFEIKVNHKIYNNKTKKGKLPFFHNITVPTSSNSLLEEIKTKLTSSLLEGSALDELIPIGSTTNKSKLMSILNRTAADIKKFNIELEDPKKNLSQTDKTVKFRISNNFEGTTIDVKFKNVKSYTEQQINNLLDTAVNKFTKPVSGTEFDDQMLINGECLNKLHEKIANILNDERININVSRFNKTLNEVNNKVKFEIKVDHKTYTNKYRQSILILEDVLASTWHKILRDVETTLVKSSIDCKKLVRDNQLLNDESTQNQIKNILKNLINNKDLNLELITKNKTLKDHKNIINIKVSNSQGNLSRIFNVELKNIKIFRIKQLDENKLKELEKKPLRLLLDFAYNATKVEMKKHYMKCKILLQDGQLKNFFHSWWNKIKKMNTDARFNSVYSSLQKTVFYILDKESLKLETIFKNLNSYNEEILSTDEDVNQFYRYLEKVYQIITDKYAKL